MDQESYIREKHVFPIETAIPKCYEGTLLLITLIDLIMVNYLTISKNLKLEKLGQLPDYFTRFGC